MSPFTFISQKKNMSMDRTEEESSIPFLKRNSGILDNENLPTSSQKRRQFYHWLIPLTFIIVATNAITFYSGQYLRTHNIDTMCARHTSQAWKHVDVSYKATPFNGSFFKETLYRQPPSPKVDAAWDAIGVNLKAIILPIGEAERSGVSLDHLQVGAKYGGPRFPVLIEGLHHIHCLNLLRKSLYFNADYYQHLKQGSFANSEDTIRIHIGHCLHTPRQTLMCTVDTGLVPFIWVGNPPHFPPDFNREHKCKNFEGILQYAKRMQEPPLDEMDVLPHKGALILEDFP